MCPPIVIPPVGGGEVRASEDDRGQGGLGSIVNAKAQDRIRPTRSV